MTSFPAQQSWVCELSVMKQSVLFAAVRAPDGIPKNHAVKVIMRWYRRSTLVSAFDGKPLLDPFLPGGGSFTGPFNGQHYWQHVSPRVRWEEVASVWLYATIKEKWELFNEMRKVYLNHVDELPHHFQLHLMHAAQIVGRHHPVEEVAIWWSRFYLMIVNDAHLHPETDDELDDRLSDEEALWRAREEVTAQ